MICRWMSLPLLALVALPAGGPIAEPADAVNPLLTEWKTPFQLPPFDRIRPEHFLPAFRAAIARHDTEISAIARQRSMPTFENTILALDGAGDVGELRRARGA